MKNPFRKRFPKRQIIQLKARDGRFEIMGLDAWYTYWRDPYHLLLTVPWSLFLGMIAVAYIGINLFFALLYFLQPNAIANSTPGSFSDMFFFSVQTLATIGYGAMYPQTVYANTVVMIEAMMGLVGIAVMTGLAFARFSRPQARVMFSQVAVIVPYNGVPTLMFRTANQRRNQILEAQIQVYLMQDETTIEGHSMRRIYELPLLRHRTPSFTLSWAIMHPIHETSPLYGATPEFLKQTRTTIVVTLSGMDETVMQTIHARHTYGIQDVLFDYCLADIFHPTSDETTFLVDYSHFHEVFPYRK